MSNEEIKDVIRCLIVEVNRLNSAINDKNFKIAELEVQLENKQRSESKCSMKYAEQELTELIDK